MALSWRRVVFFIPTSFPIGSMVLPIPVLVRPVVAAAVVLQPLHLVRHRLLALSATFHSSHRKTHSSGDLRNFHPFGWLSFARLSISMLACVFAWKCNWLWSRELSGLQKASKRLKRSQFADLSIQQGWKWWWLSRIIRGGCEVLGRCGWCGGRPQLEPQRPLFPPVFCSHSAKFGHSIERPPAAHTSPRELDGHTPFMDGRLRGDASCNLEPTLGPRIASTNHWGCDTILFSSTSHYVGLCVCIRLWGTLQQNEWLALLEKLLNIPPVLSQQSPTLDKNSTSEFFRPEIKQEEILKPFSPRKASARKEENENFLVNNKIMKNNDPTAPDQHLITSSSGFMRQPHWHFYAAVDKSKSFPENNDFSRKWL